MFLRVILFIFFFVSLSSGFSIKLQDSTNSIEVNNISYLKDNNFELQDLKTRKFLSYSKSTGELYTFTFETRYTYWVRFTLENTSTTTQTRNIYISYPDIKKISFFEKTDSQKEFQQLVQNHTYKRIFTAPIKLEPNQNKTILLKIENHLAPIVFNLKVLDNDALHMIEQNTMGVHSIFIGFMVFAMIYFIIAFVLIKKYIYIFYVVHIVAFAVFQLFVQGYPNIYWPTLEFFDEIKLSTALVAASGYVIFVLFFLKQSLSKRYKYMIFGILGLILMSVLLYLFAVISPEAAAIFSVLEYVIVFFASLNAFKHGNKYALNILISSLILLSGTLIHTLSVILQLIPLYEYTLYAISYSNIIEVLIILFMFVSYFKKTYEEKERIYLQKLELEKSFSQQLEKEVTNKTLELQLEKQKAEQLARTDELTQLMNRRAFIEETEFLLKEAKRYEVPLSLVLLDIDHFKKVNDTYGHETGDKVLQAFSSNVSSLIRQTDLMARIGGEEFVIVFPHTKLDETLSITTKIKQSINALEIPYEKEILKITSSFGLSELDPKKDTVTSLLARADEALYKAKHNGRNTIVCSSI